MNQLKAIFLGLCLFAMGAGVGLAQDANSGTGPPKVLQIDREFLKPGKSGAAHAKTESAYIQAIAAAKSPIRYLGMDSMSGRSRSLFFFGYPSFEAWEKENLASDQDKTLTAATDRANMADGELLSDYDQSVWAYREDMSAKNIASVSVGTMRYFEIDRYKIRPGHMAEWEEVVKMYKDAYEKAVPSANWAIYENVFGHDDGGVFLILTPMKSLAEADKSMGDTKLVETEVGKAGMKRIEELTASCVEMNESNLFRINPKISFPREEWRTADPEFWKVKPAAAMKKPQAAAPQ